MPAYDTSRGGNRPQLAPPSLIDVIRVPVIVVDPLRNFAMIRKKIGRDTLRVSVPLVEFPFLKSTSFFFFFELNYGIVSF